MEIFQNLKNGNFCSKSDSKSRKWKCLFKSRLKTRKMEIFYSFKVNGPTTADVDPATFKAESVVQPTEP